MSEKSALRRRTSEIYKGGRREGWSTASTTRDWLWRPTAHAAGVARVGVVGAAWRFESEKRSQLAPLSLKFARSNQYYSSRRYMREDMGKQCTHVHCYTARGGGRRKEGLPREPESGKRRWWRVLRGSQNGAVREVGGKRRGGRERLERRKERGGQPDKQNPCCFISARLARHRPFIRARFRPTLAATPMDPPLFPRWRSETNGTFYAVLFEFVN